MCSGAEYFFTCANRFFQRPRLSRPPSIEFIAHDMNGRAP
jgi:hypothetical protein